MTYLSHKSLQVRQGHATLGELRRNVRVRDVNASWILEGPIKVCDPLETVRDARVHDVNTSCILAGPIKVCDPLETVKEA